MSNRLRVVAARSRTAGGLALTGFALALWTAAAHLAVVAIIRALTSEMYWLWAGRDVWWIVPLGYVLLFALPVVILALCHTAAPRIARRHWVFGLWAALGLFSVLLLYTRAQTWALALLAAGGAVQLARVYHTHEPSVAKVVRRGALALATFFALFGGGGALLRGWRAQRTLARIAASSADSPNVLLLILDTVRASSMSLYGASRPTTPRLAAWAARGVTFDQAYATAPWTLPSHASMFTGYYGSEHSADWTSALDETHRTLAQAMRDAKYATGGFVGNLIYANYESGLGRGFVTYEDTKRGFAEVALNSSIGQSQAVLDAAGIWRRDRWLWGAARRLARFDMRPASGEMTHAEKPASEVTGSFLRWQTSLGNRPFFAFLNLFDAHASELAPPAYRDMFDGGAKRRDGYDGTLRYLDDQVGALLDELELRGVLQNTVVIITADHGEHFNEHGFHGHGNTLYRELLHVPLIILSGDSAAAGRRIAAQVSLRDVAATILDLARVQGVAAFPGTSLAAHWRKGSPETSPVLAEVSRTIRMAPTNPASKGNMAAVLDDSLYLVRNGDGSLEAYNYRSDTAEAHNLAIGSARPMLVARFSTLYKRALRRVDDH
jgi:arylsulfatase A-like enzyme